MNERQYEALIKTFATSIRTAQRNADDSVLNNNSHVRARNSGRPLNVERWKLEVERWKLNLGS